MVNFISISIILVFISYILLAWKMLGPIGSYSETWYKWMDVKYSSAFNIFAITTLILCGLQSIYPYQLGTKIAFGACGFFIYILSIGSHYKEYPLEHIIPTIVGIACGFLAVYLEYGLGWKLYTSLGVFTIGSLLLRKYCKEYSTLFIEFLAMICILIFFILLT